MPLKHLYFLEKVIERLEGWFIVLFLTLMVVFTSAQVALRTQYTHAHMAWANIVMGQMDWTGPLVRVLVLWITFLGASLLAGDDRHIKIDVMSVMLPKRWFPLREAILSLALVFITGLSFFSSSGFS